MGGDTEPGTCTVRCENGTLDCTSPDGDRSHGGLPAEAWIKCDGKEYKCNGES